MRAMLGRVYRALVSSGETHAPVRPAGAEARRVFGGTAREWEHLLRRRGHSRAAARSAVHTLFSGDVDAVLHDAELQRLAARHFGRNHALDR